MGSDFACQNKTSGIKLRFKVVCQNGCKWKVLASANTERIGAAAIFICYGVNNEEWKKPYTFTGWPRSKTQIHRENRSTRTMRLAVIVRYTDGQPKTETLFRSFNFAWSSICSVLLNTKATDYVLIQ